MFALEPWTTSQCQNPYKNPGVVSVGRPARPAAARTGKKIVALEQQGISLVGIPILPLLVSLARLCGHDASPRYYSISPSPCYGAQTTVRCDVSRLCKRTAMWL